MAWTVGERGRSAAHRMGTPRPVRGAARATRRGLAGNRRHSGPGAGATGDRIAVCRLSRTPGSGYPRLPQGRGPGSSGRPRSCGDRLAFGRDLRHLAPGPSAHPGTGCPTTWSDPRRYLGAASSRQRQDIEEIRGVASVGGGMTPAALQQALGLDAVTRERLEAYVALLAK